MGKRSWCSSAGGQSRREPDQFGRQLADRRTATELALGDKFNRHAFNDFVVGQGLLPLDLLAKALNDDFIPATRGR